MIDLVHIVFAGKREFRSQKLGQDVRLIIELEKMPKKLRSEKTEVSKG